MITFYSHPPKFVNYCKHSSKTWNMNILEIELGQEIMIGVLKENPVHYIEQAIECYIGIN